MNKRREKRAGERLTLKHSKHEWRIRQRLNRQNEKKSKIQFSNCTEKVYILHDAERRRESISNAMTHLDSESAQTKYTITLIHKHTRTHPSIPYK